MAPRSGGGQRGDPQRPHGRHQQTLDELTKPEAQYFCTEGGTRTGYVFFDLADPSDIPPIAEPLFQELNATVEFFPAMNAAQLGAGLDKASAAWR